MEMERYLRNVLDPGYDTSNSPPEYPYRLLDESDLIQNSGINYSVVAGYIDLYHSLDSPEYYTRLKKDWRTPAGYNESKIVVVNDQIAQNLDTTSSNLIYVADQNHLNHSSGWYCILTTTLTSSLDGYVGGLRRITIRVIGGKFHIRGYSTGGSTYKDVDTGISASSYVGVKTTFAIRHIKGYDGVHFYINGTYKKYLTIGNLSQFPSDNSYARISWDGGYGIKQKAHSIALLSTDDNEIYKNLVENFYGVLTPSITVANDGWYAELFAGGSTAITGSGTPQASTATSTGSGTVASVITGTAYTQASAATTTVTGLRIITVTGSPQADIATSSSTGSAGSTVIGIASTQADTAAASGVGLRVITGNAATQSDAAIIAGTGEVSGTVSGAGSPQAQPATASGTGLRIVTSAASPQAETATSTGTGTVGNAIVGNGTSQADTATTTGSGLRLVSGAGSAIADTATSSGTGIISGSIVATGAPQAEAATAAGSGLRLIAGTATVQAETATSYGADADQATIHPGRIYKVEPEDRIYNVA